MQKILPTRTGCKPSFTLAIAIPHDLFGQLSHSEMQKPYFGAVGALALLCIATTEAVDFPPSTAFNSRMA
jgi:hypothetical protein